MDVYSVYVLSDAKRKAVYVRYIIDGRRDVQNVLGWQLLLNPMNNNLEHRRVVPVFLMRGISCTTNSLPAIHCVVH